MKPFRAYLAEQETDYEYKLCSVENIHNAEVLAQIRLALGRYGLLELKPQGVMTKMNDAQSSTFDEYPFMPVFILKVVLSSPLSSRAAVQSVSLFTRIKDDKLAFFDKGDKIVMDGADGEQHAHPVEVDSAGAQEEVGDKRVSALVSDLMREIASDRKANTITRDVYEGFVVSHKELSQSLGHKVRRGFYMIEHHTTTGPTVTGPFKNMPVNYNYVSRITPMTILEEVEAGENLVELRVSYHDEDQQKDPKDGGSRLRGTAYEVEVVDQDTGKTYTIGVRAHSKNDARSQAVELIAAREGIEKERLIPTKPEASPGN